MVWTGVEDSSVCLILGHSLPGLEGLSASFSTLECADLPKSQTDFLLSRSENPNQLLGLGQFQVIIMPDSCAKSQVQVIARSTQLAEGLEREPALGFCRSPGSPCPALRSLAGFKLILLV